MQRLSLVLIDKEGLEEGKTWVKIIKYCFHRLPFKQTTEMKYENTVNPV